MNRLSVSFLVCSVSSGFLTLLLLNAQTVRAGVTPEISIGINSQSASNAGLLVPTLKWSTSRKWGSDWNVEGGMDLTIDTERTSKTMPFRFWGKVKRSMAGKRFHMSARADTVSDELNRVNLDLQASLGGGTTSLQLTGSADTEAGQFFKASTVKLTQQVPGFFGGTTDRWTFTPRYIWSKNSGDVRIAYAIQNTVITVDVDPKKQTASVSQRLGRNRVTPLISTNGDIELEYQRSFQSGVTVTTTVKPHSYLGIKLEEGQWEAKITTPLDGSDIRKGSRILVRRSAE